MSLQSCWIRACVPSSTAGVTTGPSVGIGHGSASRSIFPDVRVGRVSTSTSRGTSAAGIVARRCAIEVWASNVPSVRR